MNATEAVTIARLKVSRITELILTTRDQICEFAKVQDGPNLSDADALRVSGLWDVYHELKHALDRCVDARGMLGELIGENE